jgi:hypothetical protein
VVRVPLGQPLDGVLDGPEWGGGGTDYWHQRNICRADNQIALPPVIPMMQLSTVHFALQDGTIERGTV